MAIMVKKFTRLAVYAFFLVITAFLSAFLGGKKSNDEYSSQISLIPPTPTAHADLRGGGGGDSGGSAGGSCAGGGSASAGSDSDSGSDSGDCCE